MAVRSRRNLRITLGEPSLRGKSFSTREGAPTTMFSGTLVTVSCRKYRAQALVDNVNQVRKVHALSLCQSAGRASFSETYGGEITEVISSREKLNIGTGRGQTRTGCRGLA